MSYCAQYSLARSDCSVSRFAGWFAWAVFDPREPSTETFVMLRPGYSTRRIAAELKANGIIRSEDAFILWHYLHRGRSLKAGEYLLRKSSEHRRSAQAPGARRRLFPHRRHSRRLHHVRYCARHRGCRAWTCAGFPKGRAIGYRANLRTSLRSATSLEGYLFPETYQFSRMMTMREMAAAMVCQFQRGTTDRIDCGNRRVSQRKTPPQNCEIRTYMRGGHQPELPTQMRLRPNSNAP